MKDYCFIAISIIDSTAFPFSVHISSDCDNVDLVRRYVEDELSIHYGFKKIRSFECCDFKTYWYHPCRINLDNLD